MATAFPLMLPRPAPEGRRRLVPLSSRCWLAKLLASPKVTDASPLGGVQACAWAGRAPTAARPVIARSTETLTQLMLSSFLLVLGRGVLCPVGHGFVDDDHVVPLVARGLYDARVLPGSCGKVGLGRGEKGGKHGWV